MKKISAVQGMKDFFDTVKTATENYINQDAENILGKSIGPNNKELSNKSLHRIYTSAFDPSSVDTILGGSTIDAADNPFIRAWIPWCIRQNGGYT